MEEMENKETELPNLGAPEYDVDKEDRRKKMILAGVLGVLILVNMVLLILYFVMGNSGSSPDSKPQAEQTEDQNASDSEGESVNESESASESESESPEEMEPTSEAEEHVTEEAEQTLEATKPSVETPPTTVTGNTVNEHGVVFDILAVPEQVTAKIFVNLRTYPGVRSDADIAASLNHGDWATRVAIGRNGWCKLEYNGQTLYAVNSYLTTDENWSQGAAVGTNQIEEHGVLFYEASDQVTAKETTNLRSMPTTDSEVVHTIQNGEVVSRLGYADNGWSRISWNGQIVYAVTNYLITVE